MPIQEFQETVWDYYHKHGRDLPWRQTDDAYKILVSEIMLQQTQVLRVIPKYEQFLVRFPSVKALAEASLADVLKLWSGLGYNRRAKYLHEAAKQLAKKSEPWRPEDLTACLGIGENTAAATLVYAYKQPIGFIETNIRTVYIHHFFEDRTDVSDVEISPLVWATIDVENPREWCWALMDYGSFLKTSAGNASNRSRHYAKQSKFEGSKRQIRGQVLRLLNNKPAQLEELQMAIIDKRLKDVLIDLAKEGLIQKKNEQYLLAI